MKDIDGRSTGRRPDPRHRLIAEPDVRDGTVTVKLVVACHGCPAARTTLRQGLEDQLRRRHPQLRAITADSSRR
ncbi:NifU family protein [Micromonospora fulviviridis]|uniref:NifU family protein n=1 Tax=Micromonospora fulviviridis TaxID=47860 RepID=UPI00379A222E